MIFQTLIIHYANFGTPNKPSFYCILLHEYTMQFCIKMAAARAIAAAAAAVVPSASTLCSFSTRSFFWKINSLSFPSKFFFFMRERERECARIIYENKIKNFKRIWTIIHLTWTPLKIKGNLISSKANAQQAPVQ